MYEQSEFFIASQYWFAHTNLRDMLYVRKNVVNIVINKINWYFNDTSCLLMNQSVMKIWKFIEKQYSIIARIIKNVLAVLIVKIDMKRKFNFVKNVCIYCWNHMHVERSYAKLYSSNMRQTQWNVYSMKRFFSKKRWKRN